MQGADGGSRANAPFRSPAAGAELTETPAAGLLESLYVCSEPHALQAACSHGLGKEGE